MAVAYLGYEIDSSGAVVASGNLDKMTASAIKAEKGASSLGVAAQTAGKKSFFAGSGFRNMALQLNQVGQQTAASGDLLRSFTIQLPDLLLGFGTLGIAIGALAPLMVGLGTSLLGVSDDSREFGEILDDVSDAIGRYSDTADLATSSTADLIDKFGLASPILAQALADLAAIEKIEAYKSIADLNAAITDMASSWGQISGTVVVDLFAMEGGIRANRDEVRNLVSALNVMSTSDDIDAQVAAAKNLKSELIAATGGIENMTDEQREFFKALAQSVVEMESMRGAVLSADDATFDWGGSMAGVRVELNAIASIIASLGGGAISNAAKATEVAALRAGNNLKDAARAASEFKQNLELNAQISGLESKFGAAGTAMGSLLRGQAEYTMELDRTLDAERTLTIEREKAEAKASRTKSAGGKSSARAASRLAKEYGSDLESLIDSLATERETIDAWYNESQSLLDDQRAMELLGQEGHAEAKLRIEEEYQQRLSDIRNGYQGSALDQTEAFMGGMAAALQGGNDKMQAAAQAFASVEALINAYRAYNQVMADPTLPWFAKIPAAAGVLAAGMKTVQSIKSLSGSGGSSSSTSAPSATSSTSSTSQQSAIIQVTGGRTRYTIDEINDIIAGIQDASTDGVIIEGFTS